jgi:periplasmic nitrate reductase NapD
MADAGHISSLIVRALPQRLQAVTEAIGALPGAEVHRHDGVGKIVVVLETETQGEIAERLRAMEALPGVLNVSLIYHHTDELTGRDHPERL